MKELIQLLSMRNAFGDDIIAIAKGKYSLVRGWKEQWRIQKQLHGYGTR